VHLESAFKKEIVREDSSAAKSVQSVSPVIDRSGSKAPFRKCGVHFRFASVSGGKADISKPTLRAKRRHRTPRSAGLDAREFDYPARLFGFICMSLPKSAGEHSAVSIR
jgi:hypothetical protein